MNRWLGRVAVVTGASSGIGEAISKELVKHGVIVAGLARRIDRLQGLSDHLNVVNKKIFHPLKCDVTKEEDIVDCFKQIQKSLGPVSILINNAGYAASTTLLDVTAEDINQMLQTNVTGLTLCAKEAVKSMIDNGIDDGHIVNINSLAGHTILYWPEIYPLSVYTASKHAVTVLTECLRKELRERRTKIKTTSLSPGLVKTEMTVHMLELASELNIIGLEASEIADTCISILATPQNALITELTITPVGEL